VESPKSRTPLRLHPENEKGSLEAQSVSLARNFRELACSRLVLFERVIPVFVIVRNGEEFRRQEGVADREKEDHGCHEIERLSRYAACQPLPQIRDRLIVIAISGSRERRQISLGRGCRRVARAGKKSAEQNQAENQIPGRFSWDGGSATHCQFEMHGIEPSFKGFG
jgi:hypothetical protein